MAPQTLYSLRLAHTLGDLPDGEALPLSTQLLINWTAELSLPTLGLPDEHVGAQLYHLLVY